MYSIYIFSIEDFNLGTHISTLPKIQDFRDLPSKKPQSALGLRWDAPCVELWEGFLHSCLLPAVL